MKKTFYTALILFALPILLVSCGDKGIDRGLDGMWIGEVETSDLNLLATRNNQSAGAILKETFIYKIDGERVQTFRSKNYQTTINQVEVEIGTYHRDDDNLKFNVEQHSCVKEDPSRPLQHRIKYKLSADFSSVVFTFGPNKSVTFKKLAGEDADDMDQLLQNAVTGCFTNTGFNKEKLEKPAPQLDIAQKIDEFESDANMTLGEEI